MHLTKSRHRLTTTCCLLLATAPALVPQGSRAQAIRWAVRPQQSTLQPLGTLFKATLSGKTGLIDRQGRTVAEQQYDSITPFRGGYALLLNGHDRRGQRIEGILSQADGHVSQVAEEVYTTPYRWFSAQERLMPVRGEGGWGYLDTSGSLQVPCQFQRAYPFSQGLASVEVDKMTYYVTPNMDYLPIEAGYGTLVWGSTFSEGEAVVYTKQMKGYVINRQGRKVRAYKVSANEVSPNRSDHTIGTPLQLPTATDALSADLSYSVYEEDGRYGYKREGRVVLPAQMDEARPVYDGYAVVRQQGRYGVLHIGAGRLLVRNATQRILLRQNLASHPMLLNVEVPDGLREEPLVFSLSTATGQVQLTDTLYGQARHNLTFKPGGRKQDGAKEEFLLRVEADGLLLYRRSFTIEYTRDAEEVEREAAARADSIAAANAAKAPKKILQQRPAADLQQRELTKAAFTIGNPAAGSKRANPRNEFFISVPVSNTGEQAGTTTVTLYVAGKATGSKTLRVGPRSTAVARIAVPGVVKERIVAVKATLQNGHSAQANVTLVPLY